MSLRPSGGFAVLAARAARGFWGWVVNVAPSLPLFGWPAVEFGRAAGDCMLDDTLKLVDTSAIGYLIVQYDTS